MPNGSDTDGRLIGAAASARFLGGDMAVLPDCRQCGEQTITDGVIVVCQVCDMLGDGG